MNKIKKYGEVFTPLWLVNDILDKLPAEAWEEGKTFCDPACGDGNFLICVLDRKIANNHVNPLGSIYGVEIQEENAVACRERLLAMAGDTEENRATVIKNIVCANSLEYDFDFI